jgi:hypothetical protein
MNKKQHDRIARHAPVRIIGDMSREIRYEVVNTRTGECFGNHTQPEAVARAQAMTRNWNYKERFEVRVRS